MKIFLAEAALVGMIGGFFGILIGYALSFVLGGFATRLFGFTFNIVVQWQVLAIGLFFAVMISLLSGIYPAMRAARMDPAEALRYE